MPRAAVLLLAVVMCLLPPSVRAANVTERTAHFRFVYPERSEPAVRQVIAGADAELERLGRAFGQLGAVTGGDPIEVLIAADAETFFKAQPARGGVDQWAAGTAYPHLGLIILSLERDHFFSLPEIARHEIAHVALHRAALPGDVPRWFDEGMAILQAGEAVASRFETAAGAALGGRLRPLSELTRGFPHPTAEAKLAYAQSALFLNHLRTRHGLTERLPPLMVELRGGRPFEQAFAAAFGAPLSALEAEWRETLEGPLGWLPVLTGTSVLWGFGALLFLVAILRARKRRKTRASLAARAAGADEDDDSWPPTPLHVDDRRVRVEPADDA